MALPMPNPTERRRETRWSLRIPIRVLDELTEELVGRVVNVSSKGIQLVSDREFVPERTVGFILHIKTARLAHQRIPTDGRVPVRALCTWCNRDGESGLYYAGFHLFAMPSQSRWEIKRLIDALTREYYSNLDGSGSVFY